MSTATQTISWPVILSKVRKLGYTGDDCGDDVRAWIEKRYDGITINGQSISLDELEQISLKHAEEHIIGATTVDRNAKPSRVEHDVSAAGHSLELDDDQLKRLGWRRMKSYKREDLDNLDDGGFRHLGEFLKCIADSHHGRYDKRLEKWDSRATHQKVQQAFVGETGGFLIPEGFRAQVLMSADEAQPWLAARQRYEVEHSEVVVPQLADQDRSSLEIAGFALTRAGEGATLTDDAINFKLRRFVLRKAGRLVKVNTELMEDSAIDFGGMVSQVFGRAVAITQADDFIRGTGATEPVGITNSSAMYSQAKVTNQSANTITGRNILDMLSRLEPGALRNAVFLAHSSTIPELGRLTISGRTDSGGTISGFGASLFQAESPGVLGATSAVGAVWGRRVYVTEAVSAVGDANDIMLVDPTAYVYVMKAGGLRIDLDKSRFFDSDQIAFRIILRDDGAPARPTTLTDARGRVLASFVGLSERA